MRMGCFPCVGGFVLDKMAHGQFRLFKSIQKVNVCQYYSIVYIDKLFYWYNTGIYNLRSKLTSPGPSNLYRIRHDGVRKEILSVLTPGLLFFMHLYSCTIVQPTNL